MKYIVSVSVVLIVLASCATSKNSVQQLTFASNPVVAHRGAFKAKNHPENSIAALREAIQLQCTGSEFDVRMTADDSLIINHDPDYHEMIIEKTSYGELSKLPLSNGETLPTLRQYLRAGMERNRQTRLVLEIKPSGINKERGKLIAEKALRLVQDVKAVPYVVYISFDYDILRRLIELSPDVHTQYLNGDRTPEQLKTDGISGADYHFSIFKKQPEWIERAQKNNTVLNVWTVNEQKDMEWFLLNKFDYITTNEPELLLRLWKTASALRN
jgi:glycerophosphoryl diester phosphodiesterase